MGVTISGMTGAGSIRHNNRSFSAANVDRSRTEQNIVFCNEDLKQVYHMVFDEALAAYNAKKTKTRDKIPDYYEHIRQSKQEKLFHEAIFQIGNMSDCGCGTPDGERAAAALKDFAESFAERNPHLRSGGKLVFTVEHPVFTAYGTQDWHYNEKGEILHFPVDNYYYEGKRTAVFLGEKVTKYHRTLTTYLNTLLSNGFIINQIVEPQPPENMMDIPGMQDEMRRPMMLIVSANKKMDR